MEGTNRRYLRSWINSRLGLDSWMISRRFLPALGPVLWNHFIVSCCSGARRCWHTLIQGLSAGMNYMYDDQCRGRSSNRFVWNPTKKDWRKGRWPQSILREPLCYVSIFHYHQSCHVQFWFKSTSNKLSICKGSNIVVRSINHQAQATIETVPHQSTAMI